MSNGALYWNVEKVVSKGHYNYAVVKGHPFATRHGYVLEHRIVVENNLGRILEKSEVVHHKNGNKKDNRISNLEVMTKEAHARLHQLGVGRKWVTLRCPNCGVIFDKPQNVTFLAKGGRYTCCSNACKGRISRRLVLHGETIELQSAISANLQKTYRKFMENAEVTLSQGTVETIRTPPEKEKT